MEEYRASFDLEPGYLDWAVFGPLSDAVRQEALADVELLGTGRRAGMELVREHAAAASALVAEMVGGREDAVVLQPSTTDGLMQAVFGVTGGILLSRTETPALTVAVTRAAEALHVVDPQWVDPPAGYLTPEVVRDALTPATRAVAVSLVDHRTGYRADLSALREVIGERLLIVDAVHAFGVVQADYAAADVVCGAGHTWLRAGRGTGFAWFGDRARDELTPVFSGRAGTVREPTTDSVPAAAAAPRGFTVSAPDQMAAARLAAGLREAQQVGVPLIEEALVARTGELLQLADRHGLATLTPRDAGRRAGIVTLVPGADATGALAASLVNHGVTCTTRAGAVRVSAHVGTGAETLGMVEGALASFSQLRGW
ncbi:aminotransferase class V-fold PLP-dependent enzyme [Microbacterium sp. LRZ72]|uniref:aminotransferase class V-fold PLP-dependent enzyme n=1 Tax=Microbacterium sp. LRZ72 TaxID=2942481 RepID=UPI0029B924AD|nr:aminotransferase class V-fold PLP-dependent enzyme [Microbacterium sp. LRZ72]MDX2375807.1 aminotransferase class V-fold PLP-dependent enzyme [Microbacterium sp. LRZ72]